jgi:integrase/recombinase XerD
VPVRVQLGRILRRLRARRMWRSAMTIPNRPVAPNKDRTYEAEPLSSSQVQALLGQCSRRAPTGIRNRAMLTLLYRSGLRVNEMLALRPGDTNLTTHAIRVPHTKSGQPQSRGFHPSADDPLARWLDTRRSLGFRNGRLFCTLAGGPVSDRYVRKLMKHLADKAGIEKRVHPHGLRHTFAVELEQAGTPVSTISLLLGHSSIAVTARYLAHLSKHQAVTALAAVELPEIREAS